MLLDVVEVSSSEMLVHLLFSARLFATLILVFVCESVRTYWGNGFCGGDVKRLADHFGYDPGFGGDGGSVFNLLRYGVQTVSYTHLTLPSNREV